LKLDGGNGQREKEEVIASGKAGRLVRLARGVANYQYRHVSIAWPPT